MDDLNWTAVAIVAAMFAVCLINAIQKYGQRDKGAYYEREAKF